MADSQLSPRLTRPVLLLYGVGTIIGAGVYVLIGEVAGEAGWLALWSVTLAAAIAGITAVSYATLSPRFPVAAGEAAYVGEAFAARWLPTAVGLLLAFTGVVSAGVMARGFDAYLGQFLTVPSWLVVSLFVLVLGGLAGVGVHIAAGAAVAITLIEVLGLLLVLVMASEAWLDLPAKLPRMLVPSDAAALVGVGTGTVLAFYAFIGFEDIVNMAEEARRPQRDLPFAIFGSLLMATVLYVLVGAAALLSLPPEELAGASAPLAAVVRAHDGPAGLVSTISLVAVLNGALVQLVMASRVLYGLARRSALPGWLGAVNKATRAPSRAAAVVTLATLLVALALPIERLAELTSLALLIVFASVHAALIQLSDVRRAARVSIYWPALGLASCCLVVLFRLIQYASDWTTG